MAISFRFTKTTLALALIAGALFMAACQPESSSLPPAPVKFASDTLPVASAEPGYMLALEITGSAREIERGFVIEFSTEEERMLMPPFFVAHGIAYVMTPPLADTTTEVSLAIINDSGRTTDRHAQKLLVEPVAQTLVHTRETFNDATGGGLAKLASLAVESVQGLEEMDVISLADANIILGALAPQVEFLGSLGVFTDNLNDAELAVLMQLLDNSRILELLARSAGVSLDDTGSHGAALSNAWNAMIQQLLLKADFASMLIGQIRGVLALLAYGANTVSSWPVIGSIAQAIAAWATGVSAALEPVQTIINTMIPCDLVRITPLSPTMSLWPTNGTSVQARGRFETEEPFNQALFTQTVSGLVNQAATAVTARMSQNQNLAPYTNYVNQVAAMIPTWLNNWMQQQGLYQQSVVPGNTGVFLVIDNFNLDMSAYRFDVAGIVGGLLNIPYNIMQSILQFIGIGMGTPVAGYEGVAIANGSIGSYLPAADRINALSRGTTTLTYRGVHCRPASGWWAQWGFYAIDRQDATVTLYVH